MEKAYILLSLLTLVLAVGGCGGSSRGLSGDVPVFNTVVAYPKSAQPPTIESDVLVRTQVDMMVNSGPPTCNTRAQAQVCAGSTFRSDNLILSFVVETIKNAQGQPVTPNPSPVLLEKYRVRFTGCILGVYEFPVNQVLNQGETQVTIQPITLDMKMGIVSQRNFVYIHNDGCPTLFSASAYSGVCNATAHFEFDLVEINSGIKRTVRYSLAVRFADFTTSDDQCVR
ncbi:MAG: hypothetical protein NZ827_03900 [Aquificaceae bacterium]|nr:hypothetical protein [Aquificaceae bacterium]